MSALSRFDLIEIEDSQLFSQVSYSARADIFLNDWEESELREDTFIPDILNLNSGMLVLMHPGSASRITVAVSENQAKGKSINPPCDFNTDVLKT